MALGRRLAVLSLVAGLELGCACPIHVVVPTYNAVPQPAPGRLRAGAFKQEITPKIGYPLGGHSISGRVSRGRWLPLYARAFFVEDANGNAVVLVSCDLFAIPAGLQQRVAYLVNQQARGDISRRNVILAATHTHQGPGNYLTSAFYNQMASPYPGFSANLFDELAGHIKDAVIGAIADADAPGTVRMRLTTANVRQLSASGLVRMFCRNRDLDPFLANGETICAFLGLPLPQCASGHLPEPSTLRESAFNQDLDVLAISREVDGVENLVGALVFFGVHPTSMSDRLAFYSSDFVGLAMHELEQGAGPGKAVFGFFNGSEGDVSPAWGRQDVSDTRVLAREFTDAIGYAMDTRSRPGGSPPTAVERAVVGDKDRVSSGRVALQQRDFCGGTLPLMGVATVGGAEDGRAFSFDDGWRAVSRSGAELQEQFILFRLGPWRLFNKRKDQNPKRPGLDYGDSDLLSVTDILAPPGAYPKEVPVSVVKLGEVQLLVVPFEITSMVGYEVRKRLGSAVQPTIVIGLANEYLSYIASEDEYLQQDYEGAATLYGRFSAKCLADELTTASAVIGPPGTVVEYQQDFDAGPGPLFGAQIGPTFWGSNPWYSDAGLESPFAEGVGLAPWSRFAWTSGHTARLSVWQFSGAWNEVANDDGGELLLELVDGALCGKGCDRVLGWNAVWMRVDRTDRHPAVIVATSPEGIRCSASFTLADSWSSGVTSVLAEAPCPAEVHR